MYNMTNLEMQKRTSVIYSEWPQFITPWLTATIENCIHARMELEVSYVDNVTSGCTTYGSQDVSTLKRLKIDHGYGVMWDACAYEHT